MACGLMIAAFLQAVTFFDLAFSSQGKGQSVAVEYISVYSSMNVRSTTVSFLTSIFHEFGMLNTIPGTAVVTFLQIPGIHAESVNTGIHFVHPVLTA